MAASFFKAGLRAQACRFGVLFGRVAAAVVFAAGAAWGARRTISLDGEWRVAQGGLDDAVPAVFPAAAPVPGMADQAVPAFAEVGRRSALRRAFWYRRTFTAGGGARGVALLKIHKAKFGAKVFLNGRPAGEHLPNFTPALLDVGGCLKTDGGENELVIRVGADPSSVAPGRSFGYDKEKLLYLPGIYDSVELILTGAPYLVNVQAVPEPGRRTVRAVAELGRGAAGGRGILRGRVVEDASGKTAGALDGIPFTLDGEGRAKLDFEIPVAGCRLWSPEDPFLYRLELDCGTDSLSARFGMRSFRFNAGTRLAELNGRTYFLRGTNLAVFRFMEDAGRGGKVWDPVWVRALFRKMKRMNWNSFRFSLGFPPEFWYDIADEEGFLIQDEYPIWDAVPSLANMTAEFTEWMRERWNHPSVAVWDAQNETATGQTGEAIRAVRHLDLSGRPWDNGRGETGRATDCWEAHPYMYINHIYREMYPGPPFRTGCLEQAPARPWRYGGEGQIPAAQIINEYGWLWLNRDGSPTWLTDRLYRDVLGEGSTAEERRVYQAESLAALTEYWRGRRTCAGIQHFCFLTHSRPERPRSATSDAFLDLETLELEPHFERRVSDAFSPVGVCIDFWKEEMPAPAGETAVPVILLNDRYGVWRGDLELSLADGGGRPLWRDRRRVSLDGLEKKTERFSVRFPGTGGECRLTAALTGGGLGPVCSRRSIRLTRPKPRPTCF